MQIEPDVGANVRPRMANFAAVIASPEFQRHLKELNSICSRCGLGSLEDVKRPSSANHFKAEGSLFYGHFEEHQISDPPVPARTFKSNNYLLALNNKRSILEIGVNAGHSALLALTAYPFLHYHGVDICFHQYTLPCAAYLSDVFGDRFKLYQGDSRDVLPYLATHRSDLKFDLLHIDGGHGHVCCRTDFSNCLRLARRGDSILLDDAAADFIRAVFAEFACLGLLVRNDLGGLFHERDQLLATVL